MWSQMERAAVLIVDDRNTTLLALEAALSTLHVECVLARSGREALRNVLNREFAVILLDINMPDMDGFETAALIRQRKSSAHTPIIFMTADANEINVERCYSLGAIDFLSTPVLPNVLRTKVSVLVDLAQKTTQVRQQAERLRARTLQLQRLATASVEIHAAQNVEGILQATAHAARDVVGTHQAYVFMNASAEAGAVAVSSFSERYASWASAAGATAPDGLSQLALARDTVLRMSANDLTHRPEWQASARRPPLSGYLAARLCAPDGKALGLVELSDRMEGDFTDDDAAVLTQIAQLSASALASLMNAHAREANRLKNEFLAVVSHELRTPLNAILGWTQVLQTQIQDEEPRKTLATIERNVRLQARLIDDLLDTSRILNQKLEVRTQAVAFDEIVQAAVQAASPEASARGLEMSLHVPPNLRAGVLGDAERLDQVVSNLIGNALKFTPAGGRVELTLSAQTGQVVLRVADTGPGLSPEMLATIFDRFRQGENEQPRARKGLGLGLTIVRQLVQLHGGTVEASSPGPGRGAVFTVALPLSTTAQRTPSAEVALAPTPTPPSAPSTPPAPLQPRSHRDLEGLRVMVVDDDEDALYLLSYVLQRQGAQVVTFESPTQALSEFEAVEPQLIVSDLTLPEIDGFEFIRRVRTRPGASGEAMPALALSASGRQEDPQRALNAGFQSFAGKPIDTSALLQIIARLARSRRPAA